MDFSQLNWSEIKERLKTEAGYFATDEIALAIKNAQIFFLADARNNRNSPRLDLMKEFGEKAKHIFWFNPESKRKWDQGDSVISKYAPYCDAVFETRNVKQLEEALYHSIEYIEDPNLAKSV